MEVDEKFLDVESHSLMLVTGKILHPVTFYAIQLLAYLHKREIFSKSQTIGGGNDFLEFLV